MLLDSTFVAQNLVVLCAEPKTAIPISRQEVRLGTPEENLGNLVGWIGRDNEW